jgi:hypothetical protein
MPLVDPARLRLQMVIRRMARVDGDLERMVPRAA